MVGDVIERVVAQDAAAWHVLRLSRALAPGGELDEDRQALAALDAQLEATPGLLRIGFVGAGLYQRCHLLVEPTGTSLPVQLGFQIAVDVAQVDDIAARIGELFGRERPARPIREARGL